MQVRQNEKLESIGTLAGGVAQEINNPINGIMNYAQLIQDRLGPDHPATEFAAEIVNETERVSTIVRNLLAFARLEKKGHSPANMGDVLGSTLSLIQAIMHHDNIRLEVETPDGLPKVRCRSQQIQQVLMNLITNARDALNERYPKYDENKVLHIALSLIERDGQKWVRTTVEDHGTGILPEVRERMFDPFYTTKGRDKGTGLGLAISHGIVLDHDGTLLVESEPGSYTRFHIDLPVPPD
jgi:signal transduction histidine kinase